MIGLCVYAAPLPDGGALLVVPPGAIRDLGALGRLLAAHPDRLRVDVLAARGAPPVSDREVLTLVRRAACAATFAPAGPAPRRTSLPALRGAWYAALVLWGWLTLLNTAQSVASVLGGVWLAIGLPLVRRATRRRSDAAWAALAGALATSIAGASVRTLEHAGLSQIAETIVQGERREGEITAALRRVAEACAPAGVAELAPFYAALAVARTPPGIWSAVAPAAAAAAGDVGQPGDLEAVPPVRTPEAVTSDLGPRTSDLV